MKPESTAPEADALSTRPSELQGEQPAKMFFPYNTNRRTFRFVFHNYFKLMLSAKQRSCDYRFEFLVRPAGNIPAILLSHEHTRPFDKSATQDNRVFLFSCIFILVSQESDQSATTSLLGSCRLLSTTCGNPAECLYQRDNK